MPSSYTLPRESKRERRYGPPFARLRIYGEKRGGGRGKPTPNPTSTPIWKVVSMSCTRRFGLDPPPPKTPHFPGSAPAWATSPHTQKSVKPQDARCGGGGDARSESRRTVR